MDSDKQVWKCALFVWRFIKALFLYSYIGFLSLCLVVLIHSQGLNSSGTLLQNPTPYLTKLYEHIYCAHFSLTRTVNFYKDRFRTAFAHIFVFVLLIQFTSSGFQKESHLEAQRSCIFGPHGFKHLFLE